MPLGDDLHTGDDHREDDPSAHEHPLQSKRLRKNRPESLELISTCDTELGKDLSPGPQKQGGSRQMSRSLSTKQSFNTGSSVRVTFDDRLSKGDHAYMMCCKFLLVAAAIGIVTIVIYTLANNLS